VTAPFGSLTIRIAVGVVLAALCGAALFAGGFVLLAMAMTAAGLMAWEWDRLNRADSGALRLAFAGLCALAPLFGFWGGWLAAGAAVAVAGMCGVLGVRAAARGLGALGAAVAGLAPAALLLIRDFPPTEGWAFWAAAIAVASATANRLPSSSASIRAVLKAALLSSSQSESMRGPSSASLAIPSRMNSPVRNTPKCNCMMFCSSARNAEVLSPERDSSSRRSRSRLFSTSPVAALRICRPCCSSSSIFLPAALPNTTRSSRLLPPRRLAP